MADPRIANFRSAYSAPGFLESVSIGFITVFPCLARNAAAQIEPRMHIGVFQLLPRGRAATDREVVEQALWEVDFAERHGFETANEAYPHRLRSRGRATASSAAVGRGDQLG